MSRHTVLKFDDTNVFSISVGILYRTPPVHLLFNPYPSIFWCFRLSQPLLKPNDASSMSFQNNSKVCSSGLHFDPTHHHFCSCQLKYVVFPDTVFYGLFDLKFSHWHEFNSQQNWGCIIMMSYCLSMHSFLLLCLRSKCI